MKAARCPRAPYVADFSGTVSQYDVGPGGGLVPKSPPAVAAGASPIGVAVSPDGRSVYVTNVVFSPVLGSSTVSQYDVGPTGGLTPKDPPEVAAGDGARGVAVSPDGTSVYVANQGSGPGTGTVFQFDVGPGGGLTPKSPPTVASAGTFPNDVAVSPGGGSVYVTNFLGDTVSQYTVGAGGRLTAKSPPTVVAGSAPVEVAVSPDGRSVYVTNSNSNTVSQYDVAADGALTPKRPATVPAGDAPGGVAVSPPARVPLSKDQCKDGGYRQFGFRNQGQCVAFVQRGPKP